MSTGTSTPSEVDAEDDRDEQRRVDQPARACSPSATTSAIANESAKPSSVSAQHAAAQLLELDLEPGEEQHEREAEQRDHLDRLVDLDPAEHGRPDDDPGHDLEHHRRQPQRAGRGRAASGAANATATTISRFVN